MRLDVPITTPVTLAAKDGANSLLALRRAAWPLRDALIRSHRFEAMLADLANIEAQVSTLSKQLIESLYSLVPQAAGPTERRRLLALKREIFNHRPIALPLPSLPLAEAERHALDQQLGRYAELLSRHRELMVETGDPPSAEIERIVAERASRIDFQLALSASSPTMAALMGRGSTGAPRLTARGYRSLYAYICRFATKANPLHLFTHVVPGPRVHGVSASSGVRCEIVFDVESLLAFEKHLLSKPIDPSRLRLAPRPMINDGGWRVWIKRDGAWCVASLPESPILARLHAFFAERPRVGLPPSATRAELEQALIEQGDTADGPSVRKAIDGLISLGVLTCHLIEDLTDLSGALQGLDATCEGVVDCLNRWHLRRVEIADVVKLENELKTLQWKDGSDGFRYYLNSYADDDLSEAEKAAEEIRQPLMELKPALTVESNFSATNRVISSFYAEELRDGKPRAYLELLATFFRRRTSILERFEWGRRTVDYEAHVQRCSRYRGSIDETDLRNLTSALREAVVPEVCYVGPFDFAGRRFFVSNLFAGNQRFVSRYLLKRSVRAPAEQGPDGSIDVELAVPTEHNLTFVVRRYRVGFGFDNRWARGYDRWIDPVDVQVSIEGGRPVYLQAATGLPIRFHYVGFLQAQFLPIEYQLLLAGHVCGYRNPFADSMQMYVPSDTEVEYDRGVFYRQVCLRRPSWYIPTSLLRPFWSCGDLTKVTVALRRWFRTHLEAEELWFFRSHKSNRRGEKPRLLDLASPLSVNAFRHALAGGAKHVVLTRMAPNTAGLWRANGESYVSELMVEV